MHKYETQTIKSEAKRAPQKKSASPLRNQILDAAERLFGQHGFTATSTRAIAQEADVALGQLHYYFKSKRELFEAVYVRYGRLIMEERRKRLKRAVQAAKGRPVAPEALVRAFIEPFYKQDANVDRFAFIQMHARLHSEPKEIALSIRSKIYDETMLAFVDEFRSSLRHLPEEELYWRLTFVIGAYIYPLLRTGRLNVISRGVCDDNDVERATDFLARFLEGGLLAPAS